MTDASQDLVDIAARGSVTDRQYQDFISYGTAPEEMNFTVTNLTGSVQLAVSSALPNRKTVSFKAPGKDGASSGGNAGLVWINNYSGVAVNNGYPLEPGASVDIEANPLVEFWVIGTSGDKLAVMEIAGVPIV